MPSKYKNAIRKLLTLADFERGNRSSERPTFHLKRTKQLLETVDRPDKKLRTVHVAGTKGKGSTAAMIASGLSGCGYKVGLFTSPHLHKMTERICINSIPISDHKFAEIFNRLWFYVNLDKPNNDLKNTSVFEMLTVMALIYFHESKVDVAIIEVGLGGRLDSTNVINPELSVITPIGLDHIKILGDTIELIASEKAGIIKSSTPVVVSTQPAEAMKVLEQKSKEKSSPLIYAENIEILEHFFAGTNPQIVYLKGALGKYRVKLNLLGEHQIHNLKTAVAAIENLSQKFLQTSIEQIETGLSNICWPGRLQLLKIKNRRILIDGAHNIDSARALGLALKRHFPLDIQPILIIGGSRGHNVVSVAEILKELQPTIIVTQSRHPKAMSASEFATALEESKIKVHRITKNTAEALGYAKQLTIDNDLIIATGSLFIAAEIKEIIEGIKPEEYPTLHMDSHNLMG